MRYNVKVSVDGDAEKIAKCFEVEQVKQDRSGFTVKKNDDGVLIEVQADDSTALRATLNSISKLLNVYENMMKVK